jgi:hypothetical protein
MMLGAARLGRLALGLAVVPAAVVAVASGPAVAHGRFGADALFYRTEVTGMAPAVAGLTASVDPRGEWIQLSYTGPGEVIVLGYSGEPYLRITASRAEENTHSPSTFLNQSMFAQLPAATQLVSATPDWHAIAGTGNARWHDHRIHWMGQARPPEVAADPSRRHQVGAWVVRAVADGRLFDVRGTVTWIGQPSGMLSTREVLVVTGVNLPLIAGSLVWLIRSQRRRRRLANHGAQENLGGVRTEAP